MGQIKNIKLHIVTDIKGYGNKDRKSPTEIMWWETLPGAVIIFSGTFAAHLGITGMYWLRNGGQMDRAVTDAFTEKLYARDERIAGNRYEPKFLDTPDTPESSPSDE